MKLKQLAIDIAVIAILSTPAFVKATERVGATAGAAALAGGGSGTGGNSSTDNNLFVLPSTTSANASSGNVQLICPIITVVSKGRQVLFGAYSSSDIAAEPARINYICVLYHNALQSDSDADWKAFVDYAASQEQGKVK
jgi:hypothetical protein